jgi:leucyl/phenylalanyl-tRNA--protein transferase
VTEFDPQDLSSHGPLWLPPDQATPEGIVGVGGELEPTTLLHAYRKGIFAWFNEGDPIIWWSPDPRAIIPLEAVHVPRRMRSLLNHHPYRITRNTAFRQVMIGCATARDEGTWITADMIQAYCQLHELGHAHSWEVWEGEELVGGVYGVAIHGFFAGESMFYRVRDASKIALVTLLQYLTQRGFTLFDTQIINDHTQRFGAIEIPRQQYLRLLSIALGKTTVTFT